ncbi:hypothetical protein P4V04_15145 [Bacillus subtilis]|nr:hypothetical protein [Bacillus subtilis]
MFMKQLVKHLIIAGFSAAVLSFLISFDAVHRILHLKRTHTLFTKLGLYATVVYVSWDSAAWLAAAMAVYFLIECAFFSAGRAKETTISM